MALVTAPISFLGKPPAVVAVEPHWRDLLRMGPEDDPFWRRVRLAQLSFLERYLPMNVPIALVNGAIVLGSVSDDVDPGVLGWWALSQSLAIMLALATAWRKHGSPPPTGATRRELRTALWQMLLVGTGWGLLFLQALGRADPMDAMLIVAMTMAGIGCLAFTTATWPLGSLAMSGLVAACTIAGLFLNNWGEAWMVTLVMLSFILFIARGNILTTFAFFSRMRLQETLREQEEVVRLMLNEFETNGSEWLFEFDETGKLSFASTRFAEALRRPVDQVIGHRWTEFISDAEAARPLFDAARNAQPFRDVIIRAVIEGEERWWSLSGTPKLAPDGRLLGYRGVGTDITDKERAAQRIADLATFDTLTGLVNRRIVHATLEDSLRAGEGVALLFVDLDRFKSVNDSMGHGAGDRLLAQVAERLRAVVGPGGLVGRLGGDEFAVVLRGSHGPEATAIGEAIIARLSEPYRIADKSALIGASVGLAVGPHDGATVEALMRAADLALYDVKGKGRGSVRAYDRAMHKRAEERRSLELDLRNALAAGQLRMVYQPIVDVLDERIVGFEALMRWRHPVQGEISPTLFIPIAEEAGLIGRMGAWALNEACRVAAGWPRGIKLSVNLSPVQFDDPGLVEQIRQVLARHRIPPERLELELTESLFLDERPQTAETLAALKALGVRFALDDFGTGYSSLGYLQKIAFSRIKIDRSFVRASVEDSGESTAIIQAIVALAERLGMETTAEGTETREEFEVMRRLGCAQVQGFLFGRPMAAEDTARLIDRSRPLVVMEALEPAPISRRAPTPTAAYGRSQAVAAPASRPSRPVPQPLPPG
jgi:diguanylate cyclase (GGDEF)-like protein